MTYPVVVVIGVLVWCVHDSLTSRKGLAPEFISNVFRCNGCIKVQRKLEFLPHELKKDPNACQRIQSSILNLARNNNTVTMKFQNISECDQWVQFLQKSQV